MFKASIKVLGQIYEAEGETLAEALSNLAPPKGRGISILKVSNGKLSREKILGNYLTNRLFSVNKLFRELALKQTVGLFNELS